jgi:hypothetical protein
LVIWGTPLISEIFFHGDNLARNSFKSVTLIFLIILTVLLTGHTLLAVNAGVPGLAKSESEASQETVQVPENLDNDQIHTFLATLSDTQVRRLLIQELKEEAARELSEGDIKEEAGGLTRLIKKSILYPISSNGVFTNFNPVWEQIRKICPRNTNCWAKAGVERNPTQSKPLPVLSGFSWLALLPYGCSDALRQPLTAVSGTPQPST